MKKLQVFISSTYLDLKEERQAAVQAILNADHIPAGMELFKAGSQSQKETIQRWIDESDVYLLILGGRYGSIEPLTGKSYTHWEYDYAGEAGKPRFAVVISDEAFRKKGQENFNFIEVENYPKYQDFKKEVLSRMSSMFSEAKDIQLAIPGSINEITRLHPELTGWVSGSVLAELKQLEDIINTLKQENEKLVYTLNSKISNPPVFNKWKIKGKYLKYLATLFKVTEGDSWNTVDMEELGQTLNFSSMETHRIVNVLSEKNYINRVDIGGGIGITIDGILMMEELQEPINQLANLDKFLLSKLHNSKGEDMRLADFKNYFPSLDGYNEVAYHLMSIQQKGLVDYNNPFTTGGRMHKKFNNNVLGIDFRSVRITDLGNEAVELINILDYD